MVRPAAVMTSTDAAATLRAIRCTGVPITSSLPTDAAQEVIRIATSDKQAGADIHLINVNTLALADKQPDLQAMVGQARHNFPYGKSLVWANRLRNPGAGLPPDRVYGPDLFLEVIDKGRALGIRHCLLGSTPEVLAVGVGTPKQDWEAARLAAALPTTLCAVGAAFDFLAGNRKHAAMWMQRLGFEWFYRLVTEPRRLWKRLPLRHRSVNKAAGYQGEVPARFEQLLSGCAPLCH